MHDFNSPVLLNNENDFSPSSMILRITGAPILALAPIPIILAMTLHISFGCGEDRDWRFFSLWVAAAVMLLPVLWPYDLVFLLIPLVSLTAGTIPVLAISLFALSYLVAAAPLWIFLFGKFLLGLQLAASAYQRATHLQWLAPLLAYTAAYLGARGGSRLSKAKLSHVRDGSNA
jgi:hypothetical protein